MIRVRLVSVDEARQLSDIERLIKQVLNRELIDGFEPTQNVPLTCLSSRPPRPSPKKRVATQAGRRGSTAAPTKNGQRNNRRRSAVTASSQRGRRSGDSSNGRGRSRSRSH